ncbi:MAG: DUF1015 domain-containing protein [Candidatus Omnitrophica bacterium]|nr:DUF1015 domain-containing protein [Candidatus Omnitrophota bacterium]
MVEIKPFKAVSYNYKRKSCNPHKVVCPPYDVINSSQARAFRRSSSFNIIHLTKPRDESGKTSYYQARRHFHDWLKKGILIKDREPALYFYEQEYSINKRKFKRAGFIACLNLKSSPSIYGHEHTHIGPKEDRFKLLEKVRANLEPIFMLFPDKEDYFEKLFKSYAFRNKPLVSFQDSQGVAHRLWKINSSGIINKVASKMRKNVLFIADGHHRYEVSLNFRDFELKKQLRRPNNKLGSNYIMAYFCPSESKGLSIMPIHRLIKKVRKFPKEKIRKFFQFREINKKKLFSLLQAGHVNKREVGLYKDRKFYILTLRSRKFLSRIDKHYRFLDVSMLNNLILKQSLAIDAKRSNRIEFSADIDELIMQADREPGSLVFFLKPVKISDIIYLAKAGRKMPPKTTYFYPKVPSGLVIYKFNEDIENNNLPKRTENREQRTEDGSV